LRSRLVRCAHGIDRVHLQLHPGQARRVHQKAPVSRRADKITTDYPKSIGFGSSHARGFPAVLKYAGLLDSSGQPTEAYKKGLRGGTAGRALVGTAIAEAYKPLFDIYPDAHSHSDSDLVTFVKSNSNLDDEKAGLVVRTLKVLCKFGDFRGAGAADTDDDDGSNDEDSGNEGTSVAGGTAATLAVRSSST